MQALDEPLEADRHLDQPAAEVARRAVDDARAHQRLADPHVLPPVAVAAEQVGDARREVVVGVQQPGRRRDDAVAVGVRVVGERDVEAVAHLGQPRHRVRRRAVHPDLAVPVERHEAERRIELVVDDLQVEPVHLGDRRPVGGARPAERVDAEPQAGLADRVEVDHLRQVGHVGVHVVAPVQVVGPLGVAVRDAQDALQLRVEQLVRLALDPAGGVGVGRSAVRRVVLEAAVAGRVVRGRDDDAVGARRVRPRGCSSRIACEITGVGVAPPWASTQTSTPWATSTSTIVSTAGADSACVSAPRNSGPSIPCCLPVAADRLADGRHVPLGERAGQRRPAVAGGAEARRGSPGPAGRGRRRAARRRRPGRTAPGACRRADRRRSLGPQVARHVPCLVHHFPSPGRSAVGKRFQLLRHRRPQVIQSQEITFSCSIVYSAPRRKELRSTTGI